MAATVSIHGGRAYVFMKGDGGDDAKPVAVFEQVSYQVSYGVQVPFVIGKHSGGEVVLTHLNPVSVSLSGYRKFDQGAYSGVGGVTKLQDIIANQREIQIVIMDRQNPNSEIMSVVEAKAHSHSGDVTVQSLSRLRIEVTGLRYQDESGSQNDPAGDVAYREN